MSPSALALSFAAPAFLAAGLLALPLIALYLIRVKRRAVTVGYLRLWEDLLVESRARSLFERLKRWASLLVQLLILGLLVAALLEPSREARERESRQTLVLLDASASMQVREPGGQTRFELALAEARREIAARRGEDQLMLVAVSDRVEVLSPFERSGLRLREALEGAAPTQRVLAAGRALAFARQVLADQPNPRLLVLSDGSAGEVARAWEASQPRAARGPAAQPGAGAERGAGAAPSFELRCLGERAANVGITRFAARKNTSLGTDYVLAVLRNFGPEERTLRLELSVDGEVKRVLPRTLGPGQELSERFQLTLPEGGTLRLALEHERAAGDSAAGDPGDPAGPDPAGPDALASDDVAYAIVRPARLRKVLLVCEREAQLLPFRLAFEAMSEVVDPSSQALTRAEYEALPAPERAADVTLCVGRLPAELPARGNLFLVATPLPPGAPAELGEVEARPRVFDWEREHVLNRYLNWRDLPLPAAAPLQLQPEAEALVSGYEGALVAAWSQGGRRVVHVSFDLTGRLFPFRLAFPILLRNALAWFELSEDLLLRPSYAPGEVIAPLRPVAGEQVQVEFFPPGAQEPRREALPLREGRFFFSHTEAPGPVGFTLADGAVHATCVNLFAPGESAVAPTPLAASPPAGERAGSLLPSELWPLAVLLGLLLYALEWGSYHRRWTE